MSVAPEFVAVNNVLITLLGNLNIATFFSGLINAACFKSSRPPFVEPSVSSRNLPNWSVALSSVPSRSTVPASSTSARTKSALKLSDGLIKSERASLNSCVTIALCEPSISAIVKSVLSESSTIFPVSVLSDAIIFSPFEKVPTTFVSAKRVC